MCARTCVGTHEQKHLSVEAKSQLKCLPQLLSTIVFDTRSLLKLEACKLATPAAQGSKGLQGSPCLSLTNTGITGSAVGVANWGPHHCLATVGWWRHLLSLRPVLYHTSWHLWILLLASWHCGESSGDTQQCAAGIGPCYTPRTQCFSSR